MLRCLNFSELEELAESLRAWGGAQLQVVNGSADVLALRLYHNGESKWLWVGLKLPIAVFADRCPPVKKQKKPIHLFIESRLVGKTLKEVSCHWQEGRVLHLYFGGTLSDQDSGVAEIELRLFPQAKNIIARHEGKQVSALKVKDLLPVEERPDPRECRSGEEILSSLMGVESKPHQLSNAEKAIEKKLEQDLKKKQTAFEKLHRLLEEDSEDSWQKTGEWLKAAGDLEGAPEWALSQIDPRQSFTWNLQNCFEQAKKNRKKRAGREDQLKALQNEIRSLKEKIDNPSKRNVEKAQSPKADLMRSAQVKGRRRELDEGVRVNMGRSAADNLSLLRVAKAWHLWFHLRDFPGSHAILEIDKGKPLAGKMIESVSQWLIAESLGEKAIENEVYTVIWAQCRYVKPIKGDRVGRVRYQNEHSLNVRFRRQS